MGHSVTEVRPFNIICGDILSFCQENLLFSEVNWKQWLKFDCSYVVNHIKNHKIENLMDSKILSDRYLKLPVFWFEKNKEEEKTKIVQSSRNLQLYLIKQG